MLPLLTAQAEGVSAIENAVPEKLSLIQMAVSGGWLMIVLLILSIIAIYIFGSRWWAIREASKTDPHFMDNIKDLLSEGKTKPAIAMCRNNNSPVARMIEKGIERADRPLQDIQTAIENVGNVEIARLERGLPMLATISGGAPMIGFLGTVIGMIQAFFNMSQAGNNIDITLLSGGIYTAMVTTVGGLFVGIIAYFGYNYLSGKISALIFKMESVTIEFMDIINEPAATRDGQKSE